MNEFVNASENLSRQLLPILGVVVLVCLAILLMNLIKLIKKVTSTLEKADTTITLVDQSIEKVQGPLDTVAKVAGTVDKAHDATVNAVVSAKDYVSENIELLKAKLNKTESAVEEPNPEDVIGG